MKKIKVYYTKCEFLYRVDESYVWGNFDLFLHYCNNKEYTEFQNLQNNKEQHTYISNWVKKNCIFMEEK